MDFYVLAKDWNQGIVSEAISRSVASRAYYAAFLSARVGAANLAQRKAGHKETADYYLGLGGARNLAIGGKLFALHAIRKQADYDLSPPFRAEFARRAVYVAKDILKALGLSPP